MTRKIALTCAIVAGFMSANAQDKTDVLRYSLFTPGGSSRAQAIGGATGSIGGDYSSIFSNPAGVGFFKTSEFAFSLDFQQAKDKSTYLNTPASANKANFNISNIAYIIGGRKKNKNSKWQNVSVGLGYNRMINFNETSYYRGRNTGSSIGSQYVSQLRGVDTGAIHTDALTFGPFEAAATGFVVANTNPAGQLDGTWSTISPYDQGPQGVLQENSIYATGRMEQYTASVGANYDDKFYFGGALNYIHSQYERDAVFRETNDAKYNYLGYTMNYYEASTYLRTLGNGVQGNLGIIYRPVPALRLGATFITPTWLWLTDRYSAIYTTSDNTGTYSYDTYTDYNGDVESRYEVRTPWRGIVSAAYVFTPKDHSIRKPSGFLTVDYEYEDYSSSKLTFRNGGNEQSFSDAVKTDINNSYRAASNIRVGGEIKIDVWAFRLGYAYYGNPYSTSDLDASRRYYSGGIGFRNKGFYADLSYVYMNRHLADQPYFVGADQQGIATQPPPAQIKALTSNVSLGLGFKF